jgi:hypothetical protein
VALTNLRHMHNELPEQLGMVTTHEQGYDFASTDAILSISISIRYAEVMLVSYTGPCTDPLTKLTASKLLGLKLCGRRQAPYQPAPHVRLRSDTGTPPIQLLQHNTKGNVSTFIQILLVEI